MSPEAHPSGKTVYPDELQDRSWWVNWVLAVRYDEIDSAGEIEDSAVPTKQPVAPYMNDNAEPCRWNDSLPDDEHPSTTFDEVVDWEGWSVNELPAPDRVLSDELGLGIITPVGGGEGRPIILLDWDDVRDPETGEVHPVCASALEEVGGFAEISQSGEGVHQFVFGEIPGGKKKFLRHIDDEPFVGDDRPMVEMYSSGRLTAMTGTHVEGCGEDVVEGQNLVDKLCWRFGPGSNNSPGRVSDPFADERESDDSEDDSQDLEVPSHEDVADAMEQYVEFDGEHPDDWEVRRPRSIKYAAVLRGRDKKQNAELPHTANWKLIRYAALLGKEDGLSKSEIIDDLQSHPAWEDGDDTQRCRKHVNSSFRAAEDGRLSPPSVENLKKRGLLPDDYALLSELHTDGVLSGEQKWSAWASARLNDGMVTEVPTDALRHIAKDRDYYDFDACPDDADELPPKAYNRALSWVKNYWPEEAGLDIDDDEVVTTKNYKKRDEVVYGWEDVRYIYEDDRNAARHAAEALLRSEYDVMTIDETDVLHVYDPETGIYAAELSEVRGDVKDGLGEHWSTHEVNEILARLRQKPRVSNDDLNGSDLDNPHLCVDNGVLDLFDRELKDHSPDYYFRDRVPVEFDENADISAYDEFLDGLVDREEDKLALLEMVGHTLTPDAYERKWKKFLILTGDTNNGKSVFFSRVQSLLNGPEGDEANSANVKLTKIAQNRFSNNSMRGKLANIAGEIDGKKIRNTASIKDITGGDPVEIEPKGKDSFFTELNSTFMFAANDPPIIGERDKSAIASRIVPIELPYTFVEDPTKPTERQRVPEDELEDRLDDPEALSGFLNLALDGIQRLRDNSGDVSLPESFDERLRMYERNADPMREFGEQCLTNADNQYLVKADVTTIYKEFATSQGHEVSQNVNRTLHDVLRGIPDLNYTDSRPESPDYSDTSMNLRGWDERKRVVNRVKLTDKGMEYAEAAGLIEETDDTPEESDGPTTLADVNPHELNDGAILPPLRATVAGVWENQYGTLVGELHDDGTVIDIEFVGVGTEIVIESPVEEGATYEFTGLRARNEAGQRGFIEHRPTTEADLVETPEGEEYEPGEFESINADSEGGSKDSGDATIQGEGSYAEGMSDEAATDGGETDESEPQTDTDVNQSLIKRATEKITAEHDSGDEITAPSFAGRHGLSPKQGEAVLEHLTTEKGLLERLEDGYRVI